VLDISSITSHYMYRETYFTTKHKGKKVRRIDTAALVKFYERI